MPEEAFEFEDNQKATEDEGLVDYIVKSGKIRSLAACPWLLYSDYPLYYRWWWYASSSQTGT